jgi:hypothetical protein
MRDILLSNPLIQLYLLYVAALSIAFFWPRPSKPPGQKEGGGGCRPERDVRHPRTSGEADPGLPACRFRWETAGYYLLPVRELAASCSAEYAARFAPAIRQIRMR